MRKDIKMIIIALLTISFLVSLTTATESELMNLNNSANATLNPCNCTTIIHINNCTIATQDSGNFTSTTPILSNCTIITSNSGNCSAIIYIDNCTIIAPVSGNCTITIPDSGNFTSTPILSNYTIITSNPGNNTSMNLISGNYTNTAFINELIPQLKIAFENLKTQIISKLDYK